MLKQCVVCDTWFDARGSAKCCSPECKRDRERERKREQYHNDPEYRERLLERQREWLRKKQLDKKFKSLQTGIEQFLKENKGQAKNGKTGRN